MFRNNLAGWNHVSLALGGGVWGGIMFAYLFGWTQLNILEIILLLVFFVIAPLALPLLLSRSEGPWFSH